MSQSETWSDSEHEPEVVDLDEEVSQPDRSATSIEQDNSLRGNSNTDPETHKLLKQARRQRRLMAQLHMSDSEFEVDEEDLTRSGRSFRRVQKVDYNENKKQPRHRIVHVPRKRRRDTDDGEEAPLKKRRGRPPKVVTYKGVGRPPKGAKRRGPGRPRKIRVESSMPIFDAQIRYILPEDDSSSLSAPKKRRGRPPKQRTNGIYHDEEIVRRTVSPDPIESTRSASPETPTSRERPVDGAVTEITDESGESTSKESPSEHQTEFTSADGEPALPPMSERVPMSEYERQLLEATQVPLLKKLAAGNFADKLGGAAASGNYDFLETDDPEELTGIQNVIAEQYYKLSRKFADAQVTRIDELVKTIDTIVTKVKMDYTKYRGRLDNARRRYNDDKEEDPEYASSTIQSIVEKLRLPNRVQKVLFPTVIDRVLKERYAEMRRMKQRAQFELELVDRLGTGAEEIIGKRFERAVQENRDNERVRILQGMEALNREFVASTGIKIKGDVDEVEQKEGEGLSREMERVKKDLEHQGGHADLHTLEGLAEVSQIALNEKGEEWR